MLRIRAFRAIDDLKSCEKFAEGHLNVLRDYGVTKVTTAKTDWFYNPSVYVVLVESEDGKETYGGERIHIVDAYDKLPVEHAVSIVEKGIFDLVKKYEDKGITGELCGLWNSKAIAGNGVSVLLTKVGVALANLLNMQSLFVLCAPYTVSMCQQAGFVKEESIGNKGEFIYPKLDLVATLLIIKDLKNIQTADKEFAERISNLVANPIQTKQEMGPKGAYDVSYNLTFGK